MIALRPFLLLQELSPVLIAPVPAADDGPPARKHYAVEQRALRLLQIDGAEVWQRQVDVFGAVGKRSIALVEEGAGQLAVFVEEGWPLEVVNPVGASVLQD